MTEKDFSRYMGKRIILRHLATKEEHAGTVIDYSGEGLIVRMNESAKLFVDLDMIVDLRFTDKWEIKRVEK